MSPEKHQLSGVSSAEGHRDAQASPVRRGWGSWAGSTGEGTALGDLPAAP